MSRLFTERRFVDLGFIVIGIVLLDRWTKWLVETYMSFGASIPIWPGVLYITSHRNAGAAFGILQNQRIFFLFLTVMVLVFLLWYWPRALQTSWLMGLAIAFIIGGALGNAWDRLTTGEVVDMIDVRIIHYPIFNVADSAIFIGVVLWLIVSFWIHPQHDERTNPSGERMDAPQESEHTPQPNAALGSARNVKGEQRDGQR